MRAKKRKWIPQKDWETASKNFPLLAVDGILIEDGKICLIKRSIAPMTGYWALPGGFVDKGERVKTAVSREFWEETGLRVNVTGFFGVYDDPKRDPRLHTITMVHFVRRTGGKMRTSDETSDVKFFPLNKLPREIAFDHRKIIKDAVKTLEK